MPDEEALRRPGFRPGIPARLADGRVWILPEPEPEPLAPMDRALLAAVCQAEDSAERLRAEMALAIDLLERNYYLDPADYESILLFPADSPALVAAQRAFREVAQIHLSASRVPLSATAPRTPAARRLRDRIFRRAFADSADLRR